MLGLLAGLVLLAVAPAASAEISIPGLNFSPNPNDESLKMLGTFFGTADGIVKGSSPVMAALMNIFNGAVLSLASIFAFYTIVSAVVQTAHDGEVLGKRYSSLWVPIRSAGGIAAIVPAGGYSAVQMLVLWIAAQGVGLANNLWSAGVESLANNGGFAPQVQMFNDGKQIVAQLVPIAACMQANREEIDKAKNPYGHVEHAPQTSEKYDDYGFAVNGKLISCGRVNFDLASDASASTRAIHTAKKEAVREAWRTIRPAIVSLGEPGGTAAVLESAARRYDEVVYEATKAAAVAASTSAKAKYRAEIAALKEKGWTAAGGSFMTLSKLSETTNIKADAGNVGISPSHGNVYFRDEITSRTKGLTSAALTKSGGESGASGDEATSIISDLIGKKFKAFQDAIIGKSVSYGDNPILHWKSWGDLILNWVGGVLIAILAASAAAAAVGGAADAASSTPIVGWFAAGVKALGAAVIDIISKVFYIFVFVSVGFVAVGVMLAFYIPMLPYIIWVSVLLAWLVAVAEAVIASPLWMMLHLNPEGDGVGSGGTEAGYKFIAATFLRPGLSVIAFFVACSIMFAVGGFMNMTIVEVFKTTREENSMFSISSMFGVLGLAFIVMSLALAIVSKSFGLCMSIPEAILRWIGSSLTGTDSMANDSKYEFNNAAGVVIGGAKSGLQPRMRRPGPANGTPPPAAQPPGAQPPAAPTPPNADDPSPTTTGAAGGRPKAGGDMDAQDK